MKRKILLFFVSIVSVIAFYSCDRLECRNSNPIFITNEIDSDEYKKELARQLNKPENHPVRCWFQDYYKEGTREYITISIQSASLCAKGVILVKDWTKMEGIRKTEGKGYRGAELVGLSFESEKDSLKTEFVYQDIEKIVD